MYIKIDGEELAQLCVDRLMNTWHVTAPEIDIWSDYYYDIFTEGYGEDDKLDHSISEIVDNDYVNELTVISLNHDIDAEPELALQEINDMGWDEFSDIDDFLDSVVYQYDNRRFIVSNR
jgi:hypothetical protein